jgi:FG-GAP-like repeat
VLPGQGALLSHSLSAASCCLGRALVVSSSRVGTKGGSPWCDGAPTAWTPGHEASTFGQPRCLVDGNWILPKNNVTLVKGPDRHYCVTMDVNRDGLDDIICNVGAGRGMGLGANELYFTRPNGTLTALLGNRFNHGLSKYPGMRNRVSTTLSNARGVREFVFMGTLGEPRTDGLSNFHRMFRNVYTTPNQLPYFVEVPGPWTRRLSTAACSRSGDFTGDKRDDLIICQAQAPAMLARQGTTAAFYEVALPTGNDNVWNWTSVRLADVTKDGIPDLVVVAAQSPNPVLLIFRGQPSSPFFNFLKPIYRATLKWHSPDVEVLDVNNDGYADIYVVQTDFTKRHYCKPGFVKILPPNVVPGQDYANDLLFVGDNKGGFTKVVLAHAAPGCGYIAHRWDRRTMLLGQGSFDYPGYQLLLEW